MRLTQPLFSIVGRGASRAKQLILLGGGLFLIAKATYEIHDKLEGAEEEHSTPAAAAKALASRGAQIMLIDIVFSLDSVITAVGMAAHRADDHRRQRRRGGLMLVLAGPDQRVRHEASHRSRCWRWRSSC